MSFSDLLHSGETIALKTASLGTGLLASERIGFDSFLTEGSEFEKYAKLTAYLIGVEYGTDKIVEMLNLPLPNLHSQSDFGLMATAGSTALSLYLLDQIDLEGMIDNALNIGSNSMVGHYSSAFVYAVSQELALMILRKFYSP
jgi:hypothetical protein